MRTSIRNVRIFDGEEVLDCDSVTIDGATIAAVGAEEAAGATIVDGAGATLLPGLFDSHVHTSVEGLRTALVFGVTTELEMLGHWSPAQRSEIAGRDDVADLRTSMLAVTAPDGHPYAMMRHLASPAAEAGKRPATQEAAVEEDDSPPSVGVTGPQQAIEFVAAQIAAGADYIKVMIEDGRVLGIPGLPVPSHDTLVAAVEEAHRHGKLVVAHALTAESARQALAVGVDGLTHLFVDRQDPDLVAALAEADVFVIPALATSAFFMGRSAADFGDDERVRARLGPGWFRQLEPSREHDFDSLLGAVAALRDAGVEILAGTDAAPEMAGGVAHGASLHYELQLLTAGGLTPLEALRAATSRPARRFGLHDRGRIAAGLRADLLLVDGDPTTTISDTLSLRAIWRRGTPFAQATDPSM